MKRAKKDSPIRFPAFRAAFLELMGDMTIQEFADELGLSRATVGFYAAGQRIPDALGVKTIAEKCNVSADWLLGLSNIKSQDPDLSNVCQYTGLTEDAAIQLHRQLEINEHTNMSLIFLNKLLSDEKMLHHLNENLYNAALANAFYWADHDRQVTLDDIYDMEEREISAMFNEAHEKNALIRKRMEDSFRRNDSLVLIPFADITSLYIHKANLVISATIDGVVFEWESLSKEEGGF